MKEESQRKEPPSMCQHCDWYEPPSLCRAYWGDTSPTAVMCELAQAYYQAAAIAKEAMALTLTRTHPHHIDNMATSTE